MTFQDGYDLIVMGVGAGGIVAGVGASSLGARTLVVESAGRLGGECSWTGCVPSKALIHLAAAAHELRGYGAAAAADDLCAKALAETRETTARIARESDSKKLLEDHGAEVVFAAPRIVGRHKVDVDGQVVSARRLILTTGSSPSIPDIPGLVDAGFVTNKDIFDLPAPPSRLVIIGSGPIGIEMAQAFRRLGSQVTVLSRSAIILRKDDAELAEMLAGILSAEGVDIKLGVRVQRVELADGARRVHYSLEGRSESVDGDVLLVATGRQANVEDLGLETVGIESDSKGIRVSSTLCTDQGWIYAAGDIIGHHQFSHAAEYEAMIAVRNAFFPLRSRADFRWIPWCTFTEPELAHLGPTEEQLREQGIDYRVYRLPFSSDDRARVDLRPAGLVKLLSTPSGRILGAHILGPRAGELMNELVLAVKKGASMLDLATTVHIYPTLGMSVQRAADQWLAEKGSNPWLQRIARVFTRSR